MPTWQSVSPNRMTNCNLNSAEPNRAGMLDVVRGEGTNCLPVHTGAIN